MVHQAVKPKVSQEELKYRKNNYADVSKVINKNPLCTSCNVPLKSMIINGKPLLHPFLETLLCEKCYTFYGDGNFSVDEEDGSDKYCRWCGQGGTLYLCSTCTAGFCKKCIKRNLSRSILKDVEGNEWDCFCCHVKPLYDLRAQAWAASQLSQKTGAQKKKSRGHSSRRSDSDNDSDLKASSKRSSSRIQSKKPSLSYEERAYKLALTKHNEFLTEIINVCDTVKRKAEDLKNKKLSKRATESLSVESIEVFHNKILLVFDAFRNVTQVISEKNVGFFPEWKQTLEKAIEEDKKVQGSNLAENGDSKKSDDEAEEASSSKRRSKSRKEKDSDKSKIRTNEGSDESDDEIKSKKSGNSDESDNETNKDSKSKRPRRSSTYESDKESTRKANKSNNSGDDGEDEETKLKEKSKNSYDSDEEKDQSKSNKKLNSRKSSSKKKTKGSDEDSDDDSRAKSKQSKSSDDDWENEKSKSKDSDDDESEDGKRSKSKKKLSLRESKKRPVASDLDSDDEPKSESNKPSSNKSSAKSDDNEFDNDGSKSNKRMRSGSTDSEDNLSKPVQSSN